MRLEPLNNASVQQDTHSYTEPSSEDAWLNDIGPLPRSNVALKERAISPEHQIASPALETEAKPYTLIDYAEALSSPSQAMPALTDQDSSQQPDTAIEADHRPPVFHLSECIRQEVLGYGPLEALLKDEHISEITVIGPQRVYIMHNDILQELPRCFEDEHHLLRIIENMLQRAGQHVDPHWPLASFRLPGGVNVHIALPPCAINGPLITIRKSQPKPLALADFVQLGSMTQTMADFLAASVQARLNIVICGGPGSGRTTLLNTLGECIPIEEQIVTIEDVAELQWTKQRQVIALESRLTSFGETRQVPLHDLLMHALRMHPARLILGNCRGRETLELLQAMYAGCNGVLTTVHAYNLRDCLSRLEVMCLAGGIQLPATTLKAQIAGAIDIIVHVSRLRDGSCKVMNIAEVQGIEDDIFRLQSIFYYQDIGIDTETGKMQGMFRTSGLRPTCLTRFEEASISLPREMFVPEAVF